MKLLKRTTELLFLPLVLLSYFHCNETPKEKKIEIRPPFSALQTESNWSQEMDVQTDLAIIRFQPDSISFYEALNSWKKHGYKTGAITASNSIPLKNTQFPVNSGFGLQTDITGRNLYTDSGDVYVVPDSVWRDRLEIQVKEWIENGITRIVIEVPQFLAKAGYSSSFQSFWNERKNSSWINPADSAEAWYQSAKLKTIMLSQFVDSLLSSIKKNTAAKNNPIQVWLASQGSIQAAASNTLVPGLSEYKNPSMKGIIAQIPSTYPEFEYQGNTKKRFFTNAYLDYSWFVNSIDSAQAKLVISLLPLTHLQNSGFENWRRMYINLFVAALMQPSVYRMVDFVNPEAIANSEMIHSQYLEFASQLGVFQFILNSLHDIPQSDVHWLGYNWLRTGVVFSDTYMWQRGSPWSSEMTSFYQLALPLFYHGVPIQVIPLERFENETFLQQFDVLFISYEAFKPLKPIYHENIRKWVRNKGGTLFFYYGAMNAFDDIEEWWSDQYDRPHEDLFEKMRIGLYPESGIHKVVKGLVYTERSSPANLAKLNNSGELIWNTFLDVLNFVSLDSTRAEAAPQVMLQRGPYKILFNPQEIPNPKTIKIEGNFIDLTDPELAVVLQKEIAAGNIGLLLDTDYWQQDTTAIVLSSSNIRSVQLEQNRLTFTSQWLTNTPCITYIRLPRQPESVSAKNSNGDNVFFRQKWLRQFHILRIDLNNPGQPVKFEIILA